MKIFKAETGPVKITGPAPREQTHPWFWKEVQVKVSAGAGGGGSDCS